MSVWPFHAHPTPSHPFRLPYKYIKILLHYASILAEFAPGCYPIDYLPSNPFPGMERKLSKEDNDIFYTEIEERIMRVISNDDEEEELKREIGAPLPSINGEKLHLFSRSDSFVDASCYGSFDTVMRQRQTPFSCGNWQNSAWTTYEMNKVRRSALARGRNGTGVFIPRYT